MTGPRAWGGWLAAAMLTWGGLLGGQAPRETAGAVETPKVPSFVLPDQYGTNHAVRFPLPRPTLFTLADKQGAAEVTAWVTPVQVLYSNQVDIVGIANLSAAPRWFHGPIRRQLRRTYTHPVLLDWEGKVTAALRATNAGVTVLVARSDGSVLYRQTGPATAAELERLLQLLANALKHPPIKPNTD